MTPRVAFILLACLAAACGDDSSGTSGGGGAGGTSSSGTAGDTSASDGPSGVTGASDASAGSGGSPDAASSGSGPTTSGGEGGSGGGSTVACGDLVCDDICMISRFEADCEPLEEGDVCPPGTSETNCGGDGAPCCCGETPEPLYDCVNASGCEGQELDCSCLVSACEPGLDCTEVLDARTFECGVLPPA